VKAIVRALGVSATTVPSPESVQSQFSALRTTPAARTARIGRVVVQSCSARTLGRERERALAGSEGSAVTEEARGAGEVGDDGQKAHSSAAARVSTSMPRCA
jgi:hypothetical protein